VNSITGWGRYPRVSARVWAPRTKRELGRFVSDPRFRGIARGLGRSYGDSALAEAVIDARNLDHLLAFDEKSGALRCGAGLSLDSLLRWSVPRGWFPAVTPGTKFVTVGGAIAADVHGKNHHREGSFCDHVAGLRLALASGEIVDCSERNHPELFRATCGGMGLTGVIVDADIVLRKIGSTAIRRKTFRAADLREALELFDEHADATYSVAWIDCLAARRGLGRSIVMLGEHDDDGSLELRASRRLRVPFDLPSFLLNRHSIRAFNALYYRKELRKRSESTVHYEPFFYPLDGIEQWNRMYGRNGFTQYQFVVPTDAGREAVTEILGRIAASGRGSFLAVLKTFGAGNENLLSFPIRGPTLALDLKIDRGLFEFLASLDEVVVDYGGRVYLAKDVRMSERTFKKSYPTWETMQRVRAEVGAVERIGSLQSRRVGM